MTTKLSRYLKIVLLISISLMVTTIQAAEPLYMGIFPRFNPDQTRLKFTPLAKYLETQLQRPVILITSKNFQHFLHRLESGQFDLVHFNQYHYIKAHKKYGYKVILRNEEFGKSTIRGAIFVHQKSKISELGQLKGKRIMFGGGPSAMMSSIVPRLLLQQAGLTERDYQILYARNPPNAVLATFSGAADAAGTGSGVPNLPFIKELIDFEQVVLLAQSEPLAHLPWAVKDSMDDVSKKLLQKSLSELSGSDSGRKILQQANLTGLIPTDDTQYHPHRRIIKEVLGEQY